MQVKVSVPSLLNSYDNLKDILSSLETQSFSDFELDIIIPKNIDPKDEYLELFDQYKGNIRIINQSSKGFENAVNSAIQGNYDIASTVNEFAINSPIPEKLITILPADVNYARVVKSNDLNPFIVPAWGNFFGIIFNVGTNENHTIKVLANSSRLDGYFLYTPPFIGLIVALGRISYNRKKKTPAN